MRWLIDKGVDIDYQDCGFTALHLATREEDHDAIMVLLTAGANTTLKDKEGFTPYHIAAQSDDKEVLELFVTARSTSSRSNDSSHDVSDIDIEDNGGLTPLHYAVEHNRYDNVRFLLNAGADVNHGKGERYTSLHKAVVKTQSVSQVFYWHVALMPLLGTISSLSRTLHCIVPHKNVTPPCSNCYLNTEVTSVQETSAGIGLLCSSYARLITCQRSQMHNSRSCPSCWSMEPRFRLLTGMV